MEAAISKFDGFNEWKTRYEAAARNTPRGYLRILQKLYCDPRFDGPGNSRENLDFREKRRLQGDISEAEMQHPMLDCAGYLGQTFYFERHIYEPILQSLSEQERALLDGVPIAVLPIRSVNAGVTNAPTGTPVILADAGLMHIVSFFTESNMIGFAVMKDPEKTPAYIRERYRFIIDHYSTHGLAPFPEPDPSRKLSGPMWHVLALQNVCCELFVIAHEVAHILLGHLDGRQVERLSMAPAGPQAGAAGEAPTVFTHSQLQEFEADWLGYQIYRRAVIGHPLLPSQMNNVVETECFLIFQIMHLVDTLATRKADVTTHPSAKARMEHMIMRHCQEYLRQGMTSEQIGSDPFIRKLMHHYKMVERVVDYA